jgi:hypothetical protein
MSDDINSEDYKTVRREIAKWEKFRDAYPWPERGKILRADLYNFRNGKGIFTPDLGDSRDYINASVEHYFLCYSYIACGEYPVYQVEAMVKIYNAGKSAGLTPRHNPDKPVTPPSDMQKYFQRCGIDDGIYDAKIYGTPTVWLPGLPPVYYY